MPDVSISEPKQRRSQHSTEKVLDASLALLVESGIEGFTIADVSRRAEMSVGAIYARFGNKENLLRVVHARAMDRMTAEHAALAEARGPRSTDLRGSVVEAVELVAAAFERNRPLLRAFMHLGAVDERVSKRGAESSQELSQRFKEIVLEHEEELVDAEPDMRVDVAFRMAYCTFARQVMYGPVFESELAVSWPRLVDEVGAACAAYLLDSSPRRRPDGVARAAR